MMLVNILQQILLQVIIFTSVPLVDIPRLYLLSWFSHVPYCLIISSGFCITLPFFNNKYAISTLKCFIATHKRLHDF